MTIDSLFSKIIRGDIPSFKIYEDAKTYAFLDINPLEPGHTLVIPKSQVDSIWDLEEKDYAALNASAKKIAKHMESMLDCKRVGVIVEGFEVPHAHIHLIPLQTGLRQTYEKQLKEPAPQSELEAMQKKLRM